MSLLLVSVAALLIMSCGTQESGVPSPGLPKAPSSGTPPVPSPTAPPATEPADENKTPADVPLAISVAKNLEIPWALDFLPDGSLIFTERPGRIRLIDAQEGLLPEPLLTIDEVAHRGEGGLLGIAVHPDFAKNQFIYVYYT